MHRHDNLLATYSNRNVQLSLLSDPTILVDPTKWRDLTNGSLGETS
jgi:hypothetical protein